MLGASERLSVEFLNWESRGRGFSVWDFPVVPEPLFFPFPGHGVVANLSAADDGRKPTRMSSFIRRLSERLAPPSPAAGEDPEKRRQRTPRMYTRESILELRALLPERLEFNAGENQEFCEALRTCREPVAFEIVATSREIWSQFSLSPADERAVSRAVESCFPAVALVPTPQGLAEAWGDTGRPHVGIVEFGLGREFMIPLVPPKSDPFAGLCAALAAIEEGEVVVFQIIASPAVAPWEDSVMRAVTHGDGSEYFANAPELLSGARKKTELPLSACVVRLAATAEHHDRVWELITSAGVALGAYANRKGNELIPLHNDDYDRKEHEHDMLLRQTHRSGMLLNSSELAGLLHFPSSGVREPKLRQGQKKSKAAPASLSEGVRLGVNLHHGTERPVMLSTDKRLMHMHVVGASGTGKSTLFFNLARQDMENGEGITVVDPHGDLVEQLLAVVPRERLQDVVLLDPADEQSIVGFNILSAQGDWERNLLASELVSVFRRLSSSWGDQMNSVIRNAVLAFLKSDRGGTLVELRRFLLEPPFRAQFLKSVRDENVVYYWQKAFPSLAGNKSVGSVVTRLDAFLGPEALRLMVGQKENRIDVGDIMDSGKIFLVKLSQGLIGEDNAKLLGSFIVAKLQSKAMSRQSQSETSRRAHFLYCDEFQEVQTESIAKCLSGVRKYGLGMVLGHQELWQVEREPDVARALLSNAYTRIVLRVGDRDAKALSEGFSFFDAADLRNLSRGEAICRIERSDADFNLSIDRPQHAEGKEATVWRMTVIDASRRTYGTPKANIAQKPPEEGLHEEVVTDCEMTESAKELPAEGASASLPPKAAAPRTVSAEPKVSSSTSRSSVQKPETNDERTTFPAPDLGKGGAQHIAVQNRIKEAAEKAGYRVFVEQQVPGLGQIDLVLTRDTLSIACEVTVSETIDYEVRNIAKCIKAGFTQIAMIGVSDEKLRKLAAAVENSLGAEKAELVAYYLPDAFLEWFTTLPVPNPSTAPPQRTRGGRVLKRAVAALSLEEAKAKEAQALKLMADLMKKNRARTD